MRQRGHTWQICELVDYNVSQISVVYLVKYMITVGPVQRLMWIHWLPLMMCSFECFISYGITSFCGSNCQNVRVTNLSYDIKKIYGFALYTGIAG